MTVVVNHDTGKAVWVAPSHGKEVLANFFSLLTEEQRNAIKIVSADGARWITACIEEYCRKRFKTRRIVNLVNLI